MLSTSITTKLQSPFLCDPLKLCSFPFQKLFKTQRPAVSFPCIRADLDQNTIVAITAGVASIAVGIGIPVFYEIQINKPNERTHSHAFPAMVLELKDADFVWGRGRLQLSLEGVRRKSRVALTVMALVL
ncbi:unnamed protein product [Cuscuta epithymum]|uniref:Uncharacterized protein n=1 Tax=Cuscuta epithymum TaxID=186058 RepID=A0AAV0CQT2_9ASTE|nr:unnamed protein product [Cuscuta epithymum]